MKIDVKEVVKNNETVWQVKLNDRPLHFRCQAEAEAFAERLATRIEAPHALPETFFDGDSEFVAPETD
ncbi:hypothetical protein ACE0DR_27635 [Azotobacter sp. CWF10]